MASNLVDLVDLTDDGLDGEACLEQLSFVLKDLRENQEHLVDPSNRDLQNHLDRVNILSQAAKREFKFNANTILLKNDVSAVNQIATLGCQKVNNVLLSQTEFDYLEFAGKLRQYFGIVERQPTEDNLIEMGHFAQEIFKQTPQWQIMYGSLERGDKSAEISQKPERKKRPVDKLAEQSQPDRIATYDEGNHEAMMTAEVTRIRTVLVQYYKTNPNKPVTFWEFVIDPDFFNKTVENIFHMSFLFQGSLVTVTKDGHIKPTQPKKTKDNEEPPTLQHHHVTISYPKWREMINKLGIKKPMIPRSQARARHT